MTYLFQLTSNQTAVLLACFGYAEEVSVPAALCGYPVCALAPYAFSDMRSLSALQEEFWSSSPVYACSDETAALTPEAFSERKSGLADGSAPPPFPVTAITETSFCCGGSTSSLPRLCGGAVSAVSLPASVRQIGRYAFYGCDKLRRIRMYSTADLGVGLFMGCDAVSEIDMTVAEESRSCLQEVLLTFRKPLELHFRIQKKTDTSPSAYACPVKYHLIFPEYFENADENTPARITTRDLHGSGLFYRNCFANTQFQIARYDSLFPHAEANEPEAVTTALAFFRLACPVDLDEASRARYGRYLAAHTGALAELLAARFQKGLLHISHLEDAFSAPPLSEESFFGPLLDETARLRVPALSSILMELRHRRLHFSHAEAWRGALPASDETASRRSAPSETPRPAPGKLPASCSHQCSDTPDEAQTVQEKQPRRRHFEL